MVNHFNSLECAVCKDILFDPRALPCGHIFCGSGRDCLKSLETETSITCAICRSSVDMKTSDVKPLYAVREFLETTFHANAGETFCEKHNGHSFNLCCTDCEVMVCSSCIECDHDRHAIRSLKKYFDDVTESFDRKFPNSASQFCHDMDETVLRSGSLLNFLQPVTEDLTRITSSAMQNKILIYKCLEEKTGAVARTTHGRSPTLKDFKCLREATKMGKEIPAPPSSEIFSPKVVMNSLLEKPNLYSFNFVQSKCGSYSGFGVELDAKLRPIRNYKTNPSSCSTEFLFITVACCEKREWAAEMDLLVSCKIENRTDPTRSIKIDLPWEYPFVKKLEFQCMSSSEALYRCSDWLNEKGMPVHFEFNFELKNSQNTHASKKAKHF